ncbi:carbamoyltransferase HypF [Frankia nepalensis]|uniref:carbamoyltransferase HypF n=1 Tax=Frankia nepalensis TaxID=1836974 RepID=UPI003898D6FB
MPASPVPTLVAPAGPAAAAEAGAPAETAGSAGARVRHRFTVYGVVQGVGFRPFVHATATGLGLAGSVRNDSAGVQTEVEGPWEAVEEFGRLLRENAPPLAQIERVTVDALPPRGERDFTIAPSGPAAAGRTQAPADTATCAECLRELADPADRRYRHPFITCTHCGPRFTIITDLPYDRPVTTMAGFPMCADCEREYTDPTDRRFHAQPIACPACGPRLEFLAPDGRRASGDEEALAGAARLLADGGVLAVKGIGGYHLACLATDEAAVATLRRRKRRGDKPFAVMAADLATARGIVELDDAETRLLTSPARPIVLARRRADPRPRPADAVAPGNPDLGLMLPYTPVHHLLFGPRPRGAGDAGLPGIAVLVMTSGNLAGEPIAADDADAARRLAHLADGWLRHDRPIHIPCDDSVVRVVDGIEVMVRRSRGYAPLPVRLPFAVAPTLAVGADLKNSCCLGSGRSAWLSGHVGDMDDLATLAAFDGAVTHLEHLTGTRPLRLAADAHPGYRSRAWATERSRARSARTDGRPAPDSPARPVRFVQHHHAHIAAAMVERGLDGTTPVIGFAFDGTGYGTDGTVWGGEVLIADYLGFRRFAHLGHVPLAGGDASVRRPYRMALTHLAAAGIAWEPDLPPVAAAPPNEREVLARQLRGGLGVVPTSSVGRLFDAVSALLGVRQTVDFDAQAAIELEARSRGATADGRPYRFELREPAAAGGPLIADPGPVVRAVVADWRGGVDVATAGARFHEALVALVVTLAQRARRDLGLETVALAGGVFLNALLLASARRALLGAGFDVVVSRSVPPDDGGLALGQLVVAAAGDRLEREARPAGPAVADRKR